MKALLQICSVLLLSVLLPGLSRAALNRQNNLLGKFYVSGVNGAVTCVTDGRILELKKGDSITARGAILETAAGANATIVFSNQTGVYLDEKTRFEVEKFDQEFFAPNNNLRVEPSNSSTIVRLSAGRVVISTPRLLSGTTMVYETPHTAVGIRGDKLLIETSDKQTHVAMIAGNATVNPRDADGNFVSIGKRLTTGQEAFVKYTLGGGTTNDDDAPAAPPLAAPAAPAVAGVSIHPVSKQTEALILKLTGSAHAKLPKAAAAAPLSEGQRLPQGTVISTDEASEVHLQPFDGAIATLLPKSSVEIETLATVTDGDVVKKRTALLALKAGTLVSNLDPARHATTDYGVRTPKGIARARGTSFSVSVEGEKFSVTTTADAVAFTSAAGTTYQIAAGQVVVTSAGGEPQPPISLASAVLSRPEFAAVIQTALDVVTRVVQNNIGDLPADSALNLLTKVAHTAAAAMPNLAADFAAKAVTAVTAPSSATAGNAATAVAAVTQSIVSAAPGQAVAVAVAAAQLLPGQAPAIAAAAAKAAPPESAPQIAAAVARTLVQTDAQGAATPASVQAVAAVGAAVGAAVQNQAAPVAAAVMQALTQAAPQTPPLVQAQSAATIAAAVTTAVPNQAVPVAAAMMKVLTQNLPDATPQLLSQSAATLAAAVTAVVPPQAQEVATAVMALLLQAGPMNAPGAALDAAGLMAASLAQVAPDQSSAVNAGLAGTLGQPVAAITASAAQFTAQAAGIAGIVSQISQAAAGAAQIAGQASSVLNNAAQFANAAAGVGGNTSGAGGLAGGGTNQLGGDGIGAGADASGGGSNSATSIIITQFDPNEVGQLTSDLEAAQNAQGGVQFNTDTGNNGTGTPGASGTGGGIIVPVPVTPSNPPVDFVTSPANLGAG